MYKASALLLVGTLFLSGCSVDTVTNVVDGDTVDLQDGTRIRLAGIDTPEEGQCGFDEATEAMSDLVLNQRVTVIPTDEEPDRYGRVIAYIDVNGEDAGLELIEQGLAIARYDSRDGYGHHKRQEEYIQADLTAPNKGCYN